VAALARQLAAETQEARVRGLAASVAAILAASLAIDAAQARTDLRTISCVDAREQVFLNGAVVFTTSDTTYQRFVEGQRQCQPSDEIAVPAIAATRDNPECWVGYTCRNRSNFKSDN
jgi:hypothetical protein